ncbi:MAG: hypothetical protein OEY86_00900 [Nitrospira sp.]|nr:hypothetical protein [Nitrospira sp.]
MNAFFARVHNWLAGLIGESTVVIVPVPSAGEVFRQTSMILGGSLLTAGEGSLEVWDCTSYQACRLYGMPSLVHPNQE